jgi:hypothetical protein
MKAEDSWGSLIRNGTTVATNAFHDPQRALNLLRATLAVFSCSAAHYAGFVVSLPLSVIEMVATGFAVEFVALFWFFVFVSILLAKGLIAVLQGVRATATIIVERVHAAFRGRLGARTFLRYQDQKAGFGVFWFAINAATFSFSFWIVYLHGGAVIANIVRREARWITDAHLIQLFIFNAMSLLILPILFYQFRGLLLAPKAFLSRMRSPSRRLKTMQTLSEAFYPVAAFSVILSFAAGVARFNTLVERPDMTYIDARYSTTGAVLLRNSNMTLLLEGKRRTRRYLLFHPHFIASVSDSPDSFPDILPQRQPPHK